MASNGGTELEKLRVYIRALETDLNAAGDEIHQLRGQWEAERRDRKWWAANNSRERQTLEKLLAQQDSVIELTTHYLDDLLDRARALRISEYPRHEAGAYVMYAKTRLEELVAKVAALSE